ncbi:NADase-type glycan-binding domain-containing protein [Kribbella sp. CA-253562]|uniref:NADase-type glycan-binding domain-containing protein n=1 Tax=Kribbella sp. CA-253562 TaxID=3239942 RepID=UPI003D90502D
MDSRIPPPGQLRQRIRRGLRLITALVVLAGVGLAVGPQRPRLIEAYHAVLNKTLDPIVVRPTSHTGVAAPGHPAAHAFDGATNTFWAAPRVGNKPTKVPFVRAGFSKPANLIAFGITAGTSVQTPTYLAGPRPVEIEVVVTTGTTPVVRRFRLTDVAGFQRFGLDAPDARGVQIAVLSSTGNDPRLLTAIAELEFFASR